MATWSGITLMPAISLDLVFATSAAFRQLTTCR